MLETDIRPIKPNRNTPNQWLRDGAYGECRQEVAANSVENRYDSNGDQACNQAVFDGCRATFVVDEIVCCGFK